MPFVDKEKRRLPLAGIKPEDTSASTHEQVVWLEVMVPDTAFVAESNTIAELVHHDLHAHEIDGLGAHEMRVEGGGAGHT